MRNKKITKRDREEQITLIAMVKGHPELWDYKHQGYNNNVVLLNAWDRIGKLFGFSSKEMRMRWKRLRDMHRKQYMAEVRTGKTSKWAYYKHMSFLKDYYDQAKVERMKQEEQRKKETTGNSDNILCVPDIQHIKTENEETGKNSETNIRTTDNSDNILCVPDIQHMKTENEETEKNSEMNIVNVESIKEEAMSDGETETSQTPQVVDNPEDREEEIQSFLKKLLPSVENMSNKQMRMFKTKVSELVESILDR